MDLALLNLTPEFGGISFGPFPAGNVALGGDAQHCHIALSPALGLDPVAAWVVLQADGVHWLHPTRIGGGVHLFRAGGSGEELTGAAQLRFGDAFSVGGLHGPRFVLQPVATPSQSAGGLSLGGRRVPTVGDMGREVQRQASARAMTVGPLAQASQLAYKARSGALFQPRYLVAGAVALVAAATTGCAGLLAVLREML